VLKHGRADLRSQFIEKLPVCAAGKAFALDAQRNGSYEQTDILPARVMELHEKFRAVAVDALGELGKRLDVVVMADCELRKRARAGLIVDAGYLGYDKSRAALGALLVVVHHFLRGLSVELTEAHEHGRHDHAILYLA
jgi:hypothetical protein